MVAATDPTYGDVALAAYTHPFTEVDSTYYHPLYRRTVATLGFAPPTVTADAACDAWPIEETCAAPGGRTAIPLNTRGPPAPHRLPDGTPLCPTGLAMSPSYAFDHTGG